jgi:hypothetical protein
VVAVVSGRDFAGQRRIRSRNIGGDYAEFRRFGRGETGPGLAGT